MGPSPVAAASCFVLPDRTSPAANTPGFALDADEIGVADPDDVVAVLGEGGVGVLQPSTR